MDFFLSESCTVQVIITICYAGKVLCAVGYLCNQYKNELQNG